MGPGGSVGFSLSIWQSTVKSVTSILEPAIMKAQVSTSYQPFNHLCPNSWFKAAFGNAVAAGVLSMLNVLLGNAGDITLGSLKTINPK